MVRQLNKSRKQAPCSVARQLAPVVSLAIATMLGLTGAAIAQSADAVPEYDHEAVAFDAADTDGDGVVTEAELTRDAAHGFAALDKDGNGTLAPGELAPHDLAQFKKVDANRDGVLTFIEVMTNKARALKAGDKNQDGGLSFEEMVEIVEIETGGAS